MKKHHQLLIAALLFCLGTGVQLEGAQGKKTGLIQPKTEHLKEIRANKVAGVRANKIGAARAHLESKKKNLAPPLMEVARSFEEEFHQDASAPQSTALPLAVDNSQLPSFPPIIDQGDLGSCVACGTTYYQATHELGLLNGYSNKRSSAHILSPKWTYNLLNNGEDGGLYFSDAFTLLAQNGATSIQNLPYDSDYLSWDLQQQDWIGAMSARMKPFKALGGLNSAPQNLTAIKQALANGHVLTFGTYIGSWVMGPIPQAPTMDNAHVGELACSWVSGTEGGHCMTIVGYDDNIWIDLNGNGEVDEGEKGAFLVANSWGDQWGNNGFVWVAYDAFLGASQVAGAPSAGRVPAADATGSYCVYITPKSTQYRPSLVAQFDLGQTIRNQVKIAAGASTASQRSPSQYFFSGAVAFQGGSYNFHGSRSSTPTNGIFSLDLTDLMQDSNHRFYLMVADKNTQAPTTIRSLSLFDVNSGTSLPAMGVPSQINNQKITQEIDYMLPTPKKKKQLNLKITSARHGQTVKGTIPISVQPSRAISKMEFYVDAKLVSTDETAPYMTLLDTTELSNGIHKVSFIGYDENNQTARSSVILKIRN